MDLDTGDHVATGPGPKAPTGRTISLPLAGEALRLLNNFRRTATDQATDRAQAVGKLEEDVFWYTTNIVLPDRIYESLDQLRKDVSVVIVERLKSRGISPQLFKEMTPGWCLPTK
jgi:hypothetical protein